jgi:DedD protein
MATKSITDEEIQLRKRARRRLVGAVALVLIMVVFLPMVLDSEPKPLDQDVAIRIPSRDADGFESKIVPVEKPAASPTATPEPAAVVAEPSAAPAVAEPAPVAPPAEKKPIEKEPEPKQVSKAAPTTSVKESASVAKAEPKVEAKADTKKAEPFVVQLGAFSNAANAKQLQAKLSSNGIKSYTETLKTASGTQIRVRAGPFPTREAAERAKDKLKSLGLSNGVVMPQK